MADQIFSMYTFLKPGYFVFSTARAEQTLGLGQVPTSKLSKIQKFRSEVLIQNTFVTLLE